MGSRPEKWPRAVNELLPNVLFKLASQYPDLTYSENKTSDGYRKVNFSEVANAVHEVAWWIEQNVGKPAKEDGSETLVYMGPNDLRYSILILGSVMVGYKVTIILSFLLFDYSRGHPDAVPDPTLWRRSHHHAHLTCKRLSHADALCAIPHCV